MATLFGRLPRWRDGDDRLPTLDVHNAISYPFSGSDEMGSTWILPVNLAYDCLLARKGEYFGKCVVKEGKVELNVVNSAMAEGY